MRTKTRVTARSRFSRFPAVVMAFLFLSAATTAVAQVPKELPPLDGDSVSIAFGINDRSEAVGLSTDGDTETAVFWNRKGKATALPPLLGHNDSRARDINYSGVIVGESSDGSISKAVVWTRKGKVTALPEPALGDACTSSSAWAVNSRGDVVGQCSGADGDTAIIWKRGQTPVVLPPLDGYSESVARGVNYGGKAVGWSLSSTDRTAVLWRKNGTPKALLPFPDDYESRALGINARGKIVGYSDGDSATAAVWDFAGNIAALLPPDGEAPDNLDSAEGISPIGEAVGHHTYFGPDVRDVAMLWDRSGTPIELPLLEGHTKGHAYAINALGHVVGSSAPDSGPTIAVIWK